nr:Chain E, PfCSP N-terminal peptide P17 [Plasmodium falciparum]7K75_F Chain F, PfCSP N-terminal peptide P17 [Plasmodium falciparum]
KPKHKKLK